MEEKLTQLLDKLVNGTPELVDQAVTQARIYMAMNVLVEGLSIVGFSILGIWFMRHGFKWIDTEEMTSDGKDLIGIFSLILGGVSLLVSLIIVGEMSYTIVKIVSPIGAMVVKAVGL